MTSGYHPKEKVVMNGGEALHHHTNNRENMASLPGDPWLTILSNYTLRI